ncbi:MAG TPA: CBS domain-containing protein [Actinomycetota bacterium]|nr:CBS domain-containing protein [Actinomycetota bacterium]
MTAVVVTVPPEGSLEGAIRQMVEHDIGCVVVAEGDRPVGILTERDVTRRLLEDPGLLSRSVGEVMSPAVTVEPTMAVEDAFERMLARGVRRLVVTSGERLVGIVTERDLIRWVRAVVEG